LGWVEVIPAAGALRSLLARRHGTPAVPAAPPQGRRLQGGTPQGPHRPRHLGREAPPQEACLVAQPLL
jgi:hypothetical protein